MHVPWLGKRYLDSAAAGKAKGGRLQSGTKILAQCRMLNKKFPKQCKEGIQGKLISCIFTRNRKMVWSAGDGGMKYNKDASKLCWDLKLFNHVPWAKLEYFTTGRLKSDLVSCLPLPGFCDSGATSGELASMGWWQMGLSLVLLPRVPLLIQLQKINFRHQSVF